MQKTEMNENEMEKEKEVKKISETKNSNFHFSSFIVLFGLLDSQEL